ncbi:MAG: hypothetical protein D6802_03335 [Ardenticatenia bacterium]|nr:MAG: hypothetical protein D6802_03335 [Ardenticatenia bacterium]
MRKVMLGLMLGAAAGVVALMMRELEESGVLDRSDDPVEAIKLRVEEELAEQRRRLEAAIEAGRRAAERRQRELWAELNLPAPDGESAQNV